MNKKELREYLKENLDIKVDMNYNSSQVDVKILLEGEVIAKGSGSKYPKGNFGPG
jgi:hypothetical protein